MLEPSFGDIALRAACEIDFVKQGQSRDLDAVVKLVEAFDNFAKLSSDQIFWCSDDTTNTIFWTQCEIEAVSGDCTCGEVRELALKSHDRFRKFLADTNVSTEEANWLVKFCLGLHSEYLGREPIDLRRGFAA